MINHTAKIDSVRNTIEERKIIAVRSIKTGEIYFPSVLGTKPIWIGIENKKLRAFNPINASMSSDYELIHQGEEVFTIEIK